MEAQTTFLMIRPNLANLECSVPAVAMENKTRKAKEGLHLKKRESALEIGKIENTKAT